MEVALRKRCRWVNLNNPLYVKYHDEEWGVPVHDDHALFEMLTLECFQAGLSWECVLNKREAFREAYEGFDLDKVCAFDVAKVQELLDNPGIIRNRLKIEASINNAKVFKSIEEEKGSFDKYLWSWSDGEVIVESDVTTSALSDAVSKDLKKRGMKFVGSTTIYAFLQAVGIINSHEPGCFCFKAL